MVKKQYKTLGILLVLLLGISNVSAFFPQTFENSKCSQYSEISSHSVKNGLFCKWFGLGCNKKIVTCDWEKIQEGQQANPKDYNYLPDLERDCYRSCSENNLTYSETKHHLFESPDCYCEKDGVLILHKFNGGKFFSSQP